MKDAMTKQRTISTRTIQWAIWIVLVALVVTLAAFGGYYIWDRYVHVGDQSPAELEIAQMEQVIQDEPENPEARVALAESYLQSGQYGAAIEQAEQVLELYPDNEGALLIVGIAYVRLNQPDMALNSLERFVDLRKDQPMASVDTALEAACYFLGESYVKLGRYADAISVLELALGISATDADALYQLGLAYQATGQPELALQYYHKAVRLVPNFVEVYQGMIDSYAALGQPDQQAYAQGMEAYSMGDYSSALPYLEQATEALPDYAPAFLGLALTYEESGRLEEALTAIERAAELNPNDFATQQALGRIQTALEAQK